MKSRMREIFTNWRILLLVVFLIGALWSIQPQLSSDGVTIRNVIDNSSAEIAGIKAPDPQTQPVHREKVLAINSKPIDSLDDYYEIVNDFRPNTPYSILTTRDRYELRTREMTRTIILNETVEEVVTENYQENITVNGTTMLVNRTRNKTVEVPKTKTESLGMEDIGLRVYEAPSNNIRLGLDLVGGTRVVMTPVEKLDQDTFEMLIDNMERRLNIYGLSDITIREAGSLFSDERYIIVEIAGVNEEEIKQLISRQGKFEAVVGNDTVFRGGEGDITSVCKTPDCSGIDPYQGCGELQDGSWQCRFRFSISLKPDAAERMAEATDKLEVITTDEQGKPLSRDDQYLNESIDLYLDGEKVDSLNIAADLKGKSVSDIAITGSGQGVSQTEASQNALDNMKELQTILITGSLPAELKIVKTDNLSPKLGDDFLKNAILIGILSMVVVSLVVFIRYRKSQIFAPMIITMISEVVLILGFASLIRQNLDLAAIAGIVIAVGTGVDDQIVIADETLRGEMKGRYSWKEKIKRAFFIIMAAFFTTFVAMIPLLFAGAGLLKGFAITTLAGITAGVLITRPAFASLLEILLSKK